MLNLLSIYLYNKTCKKKTPRDEVQYLDPEIKGVLNNKKLYYLMRIQND